MHFSFIIEGGILNLILEFLLIGNVNVGAHSKLAAKKARKHRCTAIASDNTYGTAFLFVVFTTPSSRFMIILYTALYNISNAGLGGNMLNITYRCVNAKYAVCLVFAQRFSEAVSFLLRQAISFRFSE